MYFYFARFWQLTHKRVCFGNSKKTVSLGTTEIPVECFPLIHTIMELKSGQKKFNMRKLEELEKNQKFITIVNEVR